jgi:L-threonylcarbamoyladenylate synthase
LTLIVRCPEAPDGLVGEGDGLAVRVSPNPTVAALLANWGRPLTSTSANLTGHDPAGTVEEALHLFRERDDLADFDRPVVALDTGVAEGTLASTIVNFIESPPRLIREGPISRSEIEDYLPELE